MSDVKLRIDLQWFAGEKTEPATPKKKQEARSKGQVAKSQELPSAFILFFVFLFFLMFGGFFVDRIYHLFSVSFTEYMLLDLSIANVSYIFSNLLLRGAIMLSPIMIIVLIVAFFGNYIQFGFLMTTDPLKAKLSKLNPVEGLKRLVSLKSVVEFLKSLIKLTIVGTVVYSTLYSEKDQLLRLADVPLEFLFSYTADVTINLGIKIGIILILLAIFDYMYQRYEHNKSLRMSKQDIKDEHKRMEGDPLIKGKIREKQRRMALQRMMQEVPRADVVITNPTHFAVAIRYDAAEMESPQVIAKGQDYIALKIKEIAKEHNIITMENKPLARALYEQVEIGEHVPPELFQAVAEVLAYVYRIKRKI